MLTVKIKGTLLIIMLYKVRKCLKMFVKFFGCKKYPCYKTDLTECHVEFREKCFQTSFLKQNFNMSQKARTTDFKVTGK